ncbi:hypothetical protein AOLI_G00029280 [Acnodon oligacanthus]
MATAGTSTHLLRFVTILLMNVCVMDSQGLPEPTDITVQTHGELRTESHPTEKQEYTIILSVTIYATFDNTLTDKTSQRYQRYSKDITSSVDSVYSAKLSSYKAGSVKVIQFRPGSVIADFTIATTSNTLDFSAANRQLAFVLRDKRYNVNEDSFPHCVFWNHSLLDGIGGWELTGCEVKPLVNQAGTFKCECNHTTSFSILMSPFFVNNPVLDFITFICVGISIICLILCLIIEIIVWKPLTRNDTAYMRHVSIVNIALSLLIADICFIIGAAIVKEGGRTPVGPCSTATFFMHFFYLAVFFWTLFLALLLLYHTIMVFSRMSKTVMMVIAFFLGYGAPLLIAVITVASTAGGGGYIQEMNACWLNWNKTKALLAFVIPALTIVVINLLVLVVVLYKMIRIGVGNISQPDEKHALVVIARCVAILTPLFGLTWGFGIGTMVSSALGVHIMFALLNSLQGFFVLLFGILLDRKIREEVNQRLTIISYCCSRLQCTNAEPSSSIGLDFIGRFGLNRAYSVSNCSGSSCSINSDTLISTVQSR